MGALDDAIREHIELKRRHGASEPDLARQEHEALGPARREASAPGEPAGEEAGMAGADLGAGPAGEDFDVAATEVVPPGAELELGPEADHAAFVDADPDALEDLSPEPEALSDPEPFAETDPWAEPSLPAEPAPVSGPDDAGDEDVLEETPEFLQETPEHDRLWFEQKPPRDFDFDE